MQHSIQGRGAKPEARRFKGSFGMVVINLLQITRRHVAICVQLASRAHWYKRVNVVNEGGSNNE
jgi:hypothetical protein